jgi:V/A-type H+-transporting ATPase subunit E
MTRTAADPLTNRAKGPRQARTAPGAPPPHAGEIGQGVAALIEELRAKGVDAGAAEAARRIEAADAEAARILETARAEAARTLAEARAKAKAETEAARQDLTLAARDVVLALRGELIRRFSDNLRALVAEAVEGPDLLAPMILAAVEAAARDAGIRPGARVEVVLPPRAQSLEELRRDLEALRKDPATRFVLAEVGAALGAGITLRAGPASATGVTVRLVDRDVELDLSDDAIAAVLLAHLQPRVRALFDGIVG